MPFKDPNKIKEYSKSYYQSHKEQSKAYYQAHKEERKAACREAHKKKLMEIDGNYMELLSNLIMTEKDKVKADKLMKLYVDYERIVDKINDFLYQEYEKSNVINKM